MSHLNVEEVKAIAAEAAKAAVVELFISLGVDAKDPEAIITMQKDFAHLRHWRESIDTVKRQSLKTAVGVIMTGILGAILMYFQSRGH